MSPWLLVVTMSFIVNSYSFYANFSKLPVLNIINSVCKLQFMYFNKLLLLLLHIPKRLSGKINQFKREKHLKCISPIRVFTGAKEFHEFENNYTPNQRFLQDLKYMTLPQGQLPKNSFVKILSKTRKGLAFLTCLEWPFQVKTFWKCSKITSVWNDVDFLLFFLEIFEIFIL